MADFFSQALEESTSNKFHSKCYVDNKVCMIIIDGVSYTNLISTYVIDKLKLRTTPHPHPYKLQWLWDYRENGETWVSQQVLVKFSIGDFKDQVTCDVVPMQTTQILLGRPWELDLQTIHDGKTNKYKVTKDGKSYILAPLPPFEVAKFHRQYKEKWLEWEKQKAHEEFVKSEPSLEAKSSTASSIIALPMTSSNGKHKEMVPLSQSLKGKTNRVQGSSNEVKTSCTRFTPLVYIKSFFIKLSTNLSLQVMFFMQDFRLQGVIITQHQRLLALNSSQDVYDAYLDNLCYNFKLLVQHFELTLPLIITFPTIEEVQHHDFVFGDNLFFRNSDLFDSFRQRCQQTKLRHIIHVSSLHITSPSSFSKSWTLRNYFHLNMETTIWFNMPNEFSSHLGIWASCSFNFVPFLYLYQFLSCPCSFYHFLLLMHFCWFSGCRGKVRGRVFLGKASSPFKFDDLDSRTSPFQQGGINEDIGPDSSIGPHPTVGPTFKPTPSIGQLSFKLLGPRRS